MMLCQYLVPCKFNQLKDSMIDDLKEVFGTDLPDSDNLSQEVTKWIMKFQGQEDVPRTLQEALTQAHSDFYPNIRRFFYHSNDTTSYQCLLRKIIFVFTKTENLGECND